MASGALTLYLYDRILALFSSKPYNHPTANSEDETPMDLAPHLTNTSLQTHRGEEGVRLLDELVGCHILSDEDTVSPLELTEEDVQAIRNQMADVLAETFKAALESPIHFQVHGLVFVAGSSVLTLPLPRSPSQMHSSSTESTFWSPTRLLHRMSSLLPLSSK